MPRIVSPSAAAVPLEVASNGCFETMRAYGEKVFRLEQHLDRLYASAKFLGLSPVPERIKLRRQMMNALANSRLREATVRVALAPEGVCELPCGPAQEHMAHSVVPRIVVQRAQLPSASAYRKGIRVAVVPTRRFAVNTVDPRAKYSARLSSVMALLEAQLRGAEEALWLDELGCVTESTASNFAIVRGKVLLTAPCWMGLLAGITRDVMSELAKTLRIRFQEVALTRHDVYNADEAFLSSTIKEVLPVTIIDGRPIGKGVPGPITKRMLQTFRKLVARELGLKNDAR